MRKILAFLLAIAMLLGSICMLASCNDGVALGDKTTTEDNDSSGKGNDKDKDKTSSKDNDKTPSDDNKEANKYANIKAILYAYDDVYVYYNYNGTYGLMSKKGDIIWCVFLRTVLRIRYLPTGKGRRIVKIPRPFFLTSTAFVDTNVFM